MTRRYEVLGRWAWIGQFGTSVVALVVVVFMAIKLGLHGALLSSQVLPPTPVVDPIPSGERVVGQLPPERRWHRVLNTPART